MPVHKAAHRGTQRGLSVLRYLESDSLEIMICINKSDNLDLHLILRAALEPLLRHEGVTI